MGLRRGFIQAGAQNLLMAFRPISDEATVQIMSDFYKAPHKTGRRDSSLTISRSPGAKRSSMPSIPR